MASGRGGKKGIEAGRAYVKAWFDDSLVTRGLKRMRASIVSVSESLRSVGTKLVGSGVAIGSLFAKPIADAGRMQAVFASFATIFKGSTDAMGEWADALAKSLGRSRTDVREFMTQTQGRLLAAGMDPAQANEINKMLATRAFDLAQFWDKEDQQAFQAMQNALTGEMEMLKQFGIVIHDADTKAKLTAMGLDPKTASQAEKANARFLLMMERSAETQGTAAREAGEFSSLVKRLWAEMKTLSETVGNFLLPVVLPLMQSLAEGIGRVTEFAKANGRLIVTTAATAAAVTVLGTALIGLSFALRGAVFAVSGLSMLLRGVLWPLTLAITISLRALQGAVLAVAGTLQAMRGAAIALGVTLKGLGLISGTVSSALTIASIAMKLLRRSATMTAAALAVASGVTYAFRAAILGAQAVVAIFAVGLKLLSGGLLLLSATFALLANPVVAAALAIAAIGTAIYYAIQQGLTFGKAIDWLREKLGPLAEKVMEVFRTISDALMAGQMAAAVKVLWAAIQLAFAHGSEWIRGLWIDLTAYLAAAFVNLAASIETIWGNMLAAVIAGLTSAAQQALGITAALAEKLGMTQKAMELRLIAAGFGLAGGAATDGSAAIDQRRQQTLQTLAEDAARRRAAIDGSTADEAENLEKAMKDARMATAAANAAAEAMPPMRVDESLDTPDLPGISTKAEQSINTAAVVGTQQAADAFARATSGFRSISPGEKMLGDKLDVIAEGIDGMVDKAVVIMEGTTA